jgi:hypothetical protein
MNVEYTYGKNKVTKLTVTKNGDVRIKFATGTSDIVVESIRKDLLKVAQQVIDKKPDHTRRGNVGDNGITMYNDSKTKHETYFWKEL